MFISVCYPSFYFYIHKFIWLVLLVEKCFYPEWFCTLGDRGRKYDRMKTLSPALSAIFREKPICPESRSEPWPFDHHYTDDKQGLSHFPDNLSGLQYFVQVLIKLYTTITTVVLLDNHVTAFFTRQKVSVGDSTLTCAVQHLRTSCAMAVLVNYLFHVPVNPPTTHTSQETNEMIELCEPLQSALCLSCLCFDVSPSVQMEP